MEQEMHLSRIRDVKELAVLSDEARDVKEEMLDSSGHQVRTPTVARIKKQTTSEKQIQKEKQEEAGKVVALLGGMEVDESSGGPLVGGGQWDSPQTIISQFSPTAH